MKLLRASEHKAMPWKNGLGVTHEVALEPCNIDGAQFLWRVSLATIKGSGPFSAFPGIDRSIAALKGNTVKLIVDGQLSAELKALGSPFSFQGESIVEAINDGGETTDLNIMTLRHHASHVMKCLDLKSNPSIIGEHDLSVIVFTEQTQYSIENTHFKAEAFDVLANVSRGDTVQITTGDAAVAYLIGIDFPEPI